MDTQGSSPRRERRRASRDGFVLHAAHGLSGPVVVRTTRSGWTKRDIATVLDLYRSAGWTVSGGDANGVMCQLTA